MNEKTISEETITKMVSAAQNISDDSTLMRQKLVAIADALQPLIQTAGIEFMGDSRTYAYHDDPLTWMDRGLYHWLGVCRCYDGLGIMVVASEGRPVVFANTTRVNIENTIEKFPAFLVAYGEKLEQRHLCYASLREKTAAMLKIVEG